jgi:hypothetical protein
VELVIGEMTMDNARGRLYKSLAPL